MSTSPARDLALGQMERSEIIFALGPTNTGKTFRAIARMREHESGMMGLPLRLLAREVYDKISELEGEASVALVTGEEKRIPPQPRFWICTVEAMPLDVEVDFLAVDEIQLAGHRERGHIFTDRLLHARGRRETWFMGSQTIHRLAERLVPTGQLRKFPRLSELKCEGNYTLGSLPPRSAVVAFSANRVYETAEKIKARRGGAAIVLGALSPRARNAQVAMYQSGEVDYLVATDAIGMGLNLDIDHIAFADTRKFDGHESRDLDLGELAQIAGRAGRYLSPGGFGSFGERARLSHATSRAIERHELPSQHAAIWRNSDLDFSGPTRLLESLQQAPRQRQLRLVAEAEDTRTLTKLLAIPQVLERLRREQDLRLLWEVCQVPDYRKLLLDEHARLVLELFTRLQDEGRLSSAWLGPRIERLKIHGGDIESIMGRIAFVRTWTYVACHSSWTEEPSAWREQTSLLEDELSDALSAALTERFVERRRRSVAKRARTKATTENQGKAERSLAAQLEKFIQADPGEEELLPGFFERLIESSHSELQILADGSIHFEEAPVARLRRGRSLLEPEFQLLLDTEGGGQELRLRRRLKAFVKDYANETLGFLAHPAPPDASPAERGLRHHLKGELACVPSEDIAAVVAELSCDERAKLERSGLHFGKKYSYLRGSFKPTHIDKRRLLVRTFEASTGGPQLRLPAELQSGWKSGLPSFLASRECSPEVLSQLGYGRVQKRAVRFDLLEKLHSEAPQVPQEKRAGSAATWLGCRRKEASAILKTLGLMPTKLRQKAREV